MAGRLDLSPQGRLRVVLWTVLGTLGCMAAALWFDSFNFSAFDAAQRNRSILTDLLVPLMVGTPLLYFFSAKLRELAIAHQKLAIYASTDSLTRLLNRDAFTASVREYCSQPRTSDDPIQGALLIIDVDYFKQINDGFGHDLGDAALRLIAETIRSVVRSADVVGRIGGEEFAVFLPGATPMRAEIAAERIRQAVNDAVFAPNGDPVLLSVSVGGACFAGDTPYLALYRTADQRLYAAKASGRNRIAMAEINGQVAAAA